jgi:Glycosyltransferase
VARIEPENNIHLILKAFAKQNKLPLVLVGNWKNSDYGISLQKEFNTLPHLHLLDPIYESSLLNQLRSNAKIYIHGHSEGGTNPSLVEAMYLGLPILSFNIIYNRITTENQALYFNSENKLQNLLENLEHLDIKEMGYQLNQIANRRYLWSVIANKYSILVKGTTRIEIPTFDFELPSKLQRVIA